MISDFLRFSPKIACLPIIHGSGDYAIEVRRRMLADDFDCLAVPLPPSFQNDVERAVELLPSISAVLQDESGFAQAPVKSSLEREERLEVPSEVDPQHPRGSPGAELTGLSEAQNRRVACPCCRRADLLQHPQALLGLFAQKGQGQVKECGVDPAVVGVLVRWSEPSKGTLDLRRKLDGEKEPHTSKGMRGPTAPRSRWVPGAWGCCCAPYP